MKLYTIIESTIIDGITIEKKELKGAGIVIPTIIVGERGRGSQEGIMPVDLLPESSAKFQKNGQVSIKFGNLGKTRKELPKLIETIEVDKEDNFCLIKFSTPIGFRGCNSHTGEPLNEALDTKEYAQFPGQILIRGIISQGAAGNMGSGEQLIALMPKNMIFRIHIGGRRYGHPHEYRGLWDGTQIMCLPLEEWNLI